MFVRFRVIDSTGQPVEKAAIRMNCNGSDERLESYDFGHYLFTFNGYRNNEDSTCRLNVNSQPRPRNSNCNRQRIKWPTPVTWWSRSLAMKTK